MNPSSQRNTQLSLIPFTTIEITKFQRALINTCKILKSCFRVKNWQNLPHKIDVKLRKIEIVSVNGIEKIMEKSEIRVLITTPLNAIIS
jgi:hypothetical protein